MSKSILIIRLSSIGDIIHCTPVAKTLKTAWPDCKITWLVGEASADLVKHNPYVDEVLVWSREQFERYLKNLEFYKAAVLWRALRKMLSVKKFDTVLDIHGLFITGLIAKMPQAKRRIGMSRAREFNQLFMTETADPLSKHVVDKYLGVLRPLGITRFNRSMTVVVPQEAKNFANRFLAEAGIDKDDNVAVLVPGTTWATKNWPVVFFASLAKRICNDFTVVLCGGKAEEKLGRAIEEAGTKVLNAIGKSKLLEMAALIERAEVIVSGDTGPLYIAAALNKPTVALFGPTDPGVFAPPGDRNAVLFMQLACSHCHKRTCPKGNEAQCMRAINPETVAEHVYLVTNRCAHKNYQDAAYLMKKGSRRPEV